MVSSYKPTVSPCLSQVPDQINDAVYLLNKQMQVTCWNRAAERITGYGSGDIVGGACSGALEHCLSDGTVLCRDQCPMRKAMTTGAEIEAVVYLRHRDGHRLPIAVRISPARDDRGEVIGALQVFSDDAARMIALQRIGQLEQMADNDALTGLRNRRFMLENLGLRLAEARGSGPGCGCIFVDIDHFKSINDRYGHDAGDGALKAVAKTLAADLTPFDTVGRWGGEEFLALITLDPGRDLRKIAEELQALLRTCRVQTEGQPVTLTASLGVTTFRGDDTVEGVIQRADRLMYQSKQAGRDRISDDLDARAG